LLQEPYSTKVLKPGSGDAKEIKANHNHGSGLEEVEVFNRRKLPLQELGMR